MMETITHIWFGYGYVLAADYNKLLESSPWVKSHNGGTSGFSTDSLL